MIENLLRCNICKQSVNEKELEKHIFSTDHQEKKISLMNNAKLKENDKEDALFVLSVIDQWKE
jgi:hypothetical protein